MTREQLEFVVAARQLNLPWYFIGTAFGQTDEACRSAYRRAINKFDRIEAQESK